MPVEGFQSITVSDELYFKLQKLAKIEGISVPREIDNLLREKLAQGEYLKNIPDKEVKTSSNGTEKLQNVEA